MKKTEALFIKHMYDQIWPQIPWSSSYIKSGLVLHQDLQELLWKCLYAYSNLKG